MCNKMSDVRLSNASPTLERVDPRQPDNVRPPVCRNLFGRPDPQELRRNVAALVQEDVQAFIERYNFDPVEERPLTPRTFEWEEDDDAPEFFRRPPHGNMPRDGDAQDAAARSGRQPGRQPGSNGSRKRGAGALGSCSSERNKRSHTDGGDDDDDDDENQSDRAGSRALTAAEERPDRPEGSAEVR